MVFKDIQIETLKQFSKHTAAVVDGVIHDTRDPSRETEVTEAHTLAGFLVFGSQAPILRPVPYHCAEPLFCLSFQSVTRTHTCGVVVNGLFGEVGKLC